MKKVNTSLIIIFLIVIGFTNCKKANTLNDNDLLTVDVIKTDYPKKELILQDFMDVEYLALETNDEFINQGFVQDIGKEIILVKNRNDNGDIFIYDRKGKAIRKINRRGQGGEEYTYIFGINLDEDNNELFVNDHFLRKILVYDLHGNFKRSFKHQEDAMYNKIFNFDRDNLICHDGFFDNDGNKNGQSFLIISKQDGSITKEIEIPFKKRKSTVILQHEANGVISSSIRFNPIVPHNDGWILMEPSSDTIYSYSLDHTMRPFLARTPSVQSMDPEVFLFVRTLFDRYYFMESIKKTNTFATKQGFPTAYMMYDKWEKAIFNYNVYNGDFLNKKEVYMSMMTPLSREIESWQLLEAHQLVEDYKEGRLKGKLKEIASTLKEDDNPVIMLVKHKK